MNKRVYVVEGRNLNSELLHWWIVHGVWVVAWPNCLHLLNSDFTTGFRVAGSNLCVSLTHYRIAWAIWKEHLSWLLTFIFHTKVQLVSHCRLVTALFVPWKKKTKHRTNQKKTLRQMSTGEKKCFWSWREMPVIVRVTDCSLFDGVIEMRHLCERMPRSDWTFCRTNFQTVRVRLRLIECQMK